ncbi:uncharacterized protein ACNLHF_023083 isoform 4-T6 [Anomaloglossus baeobatrachus]|uniref:uncharacterized protein LOC142317006 isoform X3 n=1 Tax=Anomaloglossus baeobatrachus TaxID=238106 RepID=UPI003F503268
MKKSNKGILKKKTKQLKAKEDLCKALLSGLSVICQAEHTEGHVMASDEKLSWIQSQYTKYIPLLKRSKDDIAKPGRTSSETYSGLEDKCDDIREESVHLPEEVTNFKSQFTILKYFIHLSKNEGEQIDFQTIDNLLAQGSSINEVDRHGQTVMHEVSKSWHIEVAQFLIKRHADINKADHYGVTPLHVAAAMDYPDMVSFLLKQGANIDAITKGHQTPLHYAAKYDAVSSLKVLLKQDVDTKARDHKQRTALHLAAELDRSEAARLLLNLKCDASVQDDTGLSCLTMMVVNMPPVACLALDQFHTKDRANRKQRFYLNLVEPQTSGFKGTQAKSPDVWRIIVICIALGLTLYQIVEEFKEIYQSKIKMNQWKEWRKKELEKDLKYCHPMWPEEKEYLLKVIDDLQDIHPAYFKDFWNVFDWIVYFLLLAVILTHIADVVVQHNSDLHVSHVRVFAVTIVFLWLRLMKHARAIRLLGPFIVMLGKIVTDILKFLFLYGEFYIPYACAFWIIFGVRSTLPTTQPLGLVSNMTTVPQMMFSIFRMTLVDDYGFQDMYAVDPVMAYILCGTFLGVSSILCINLLIALLADTFQRVYDNATANAAMQQATMLLQIEENLSKKSKSKFERYMHTSCAPLSLFYDDDLTVDQDEDLKKVTIQIKEELGELLHLVKEQKLKNELSGMQKKRTSHGNTKSSSKPQQTNSLQRLILQSPSSESSQSLQMLIANQQEQSTALEQMNQRLQSLERMIRHSLQPNAPPGSSSTADWEQVNIQPASAIFGDRDYNPDSGLIVDPPTACHSNELDSHVTVDIVGRTRDQTSHRNA